MNDEGYYEQVAQELRRDGPKEGLWLKSLAMSNGNESAAKIQYIKWRVEQLILEDCQRTESERRRVESEKAKLQAQKDDDAINKISRVLTYASLAVVVVFIVIILLKYFG